MEITKESTEGSMPRIPNYVLETALIIYYSYSEIGNAQIQELFKREKSKSRLSPNTVVKLKDIAKKQMRKDGKFAFRPNFVNTKSAFKAWGVNIPEIEDGYKKLQKLSLLKTKYGKDKENI